jgi:hypothetical protein
MEQGIAQLTAIQDQLHDLIQHDINNPIELFMQQQQLVQHSCDTILQLINQVDSQSQVWVSLKNEMAALEQKVLAIQHEVLSLKVENAGLKHDADTDNVVKRRHSL